MEMTLKRCKYSEKLHVVQKFMLGLQGLILRIFTEAKNNKINK